MPFSPRRGAALLTGRRIRPLVVLQWFMAGEYGRVIRKRGEHSQGGETSQRPEALVHHVNSREPTGTNVEIARSVPFEPAAGYHAARLALSRFGNTAVKQCEQIKAYGLPAIFKFFAIGSWQQS
jgi:hypothetical protein